MFQNIDTSVLDETTGLKLLNYLARNDDNGRRGPRSRKELFRLKSTDAMSAEDFSIRQLKEKENQQAPKASSPKRSTLLQDQSSLFKPNCMSTPLVPTTVHTPYLPSKKSIGVQKSPPLPPIPMSQEPEIPETPEVVGSSQPPVRKTPRLTRNTTAQNIYPDLEQVGQQQNALPVVTTTPARGSVAQVAIVETAKTPGVSVVPETPVVPILPQSPVVVRAMPQSPPTQAMMPQNTIIPLLPQSPIITSPAAAAAVSPPPATTSPCIAPNKTRIRVVSPETLMEIIHQGSPPAKEQPTQQAATHPEHNAQTPITSHQEREPMETPRSGGLHLKSARRLTEVEPPMVELPKNVFTDDVPIEIADDPPQNAEPLDDSSFFVAPETPVMKNFKLVVKDCLNTEEKRRTRTRRSKSVDQEVAEHVEEEVMKAPPKRSIVAKPPPPATINKIDRASQLTIPSGSRRSSILVPSSQKRKLHSTYRELTPISSPLASTFQNKEGQYVEEEEEEVVEINPPTQIATPNKVPKRRRGRPRKQPNPEDVFQRPAKPKEKKKPKPTKPTTTQRKLSDSDESDDYMPLNELKKGQAKKKKSTAAPKSKKKKVQEEEEEEEEEVHIESAAELESAASDEPELPALPPPSPPPPPPSRDNENDDDLVFKKPTLPAPKKKRDTVTTSSANFSDSLGDSTAIRRSTRPPKPIAPILPYHLINDMREKSTSSAAHSVTYKYTYDDFRATLKSIPSYGKPYSKASSRSSSSSNSKPPRPAVITDRVNTIAEEEGEESAAPETVAKKAKTVSKKSTTKGEEKRKNAKATKKKSNDQLFDSLKEKANESYVPAAIDVVQEEEPENNNVPVDVDAETPKTHKTTGDKRMKVSKARKTTKESDSVNSIQNTYRDNFSANLPRSCSTGVDSFASMQSRSMAIVSRTMEMDSLTGVDDERVRLLEFNGGVMMTYPDYSKGSFVLHSKKERARVKGKPLVLNVVSGTVMVNLESEKQVARLSTFDEISIPVGMWYSIEKIGEAEAVVMFTWK